MDITVTFTNCPVGRPELEGAALRFRDVDPDWQVSGQRGVEEIPCAEYGCAGCEWVHRRLTGRAHLKLEAHGSRDSLRWEMSKAAGAVT